MGKSRNLNLPQHEYDQGHYGALPLASLPSGTNIPGTTFVNSGSGDWHTDYPIDMRDEGAHKGRAYILDMRGSGVSTTVNSGLATITITGGGSGSSSLVVREEDGSPSVSDVTILEFDGATVSDEGGGTALVTITASGSGVDDHGDLLGLQEDDHLIYLRNTLGEQHVISVLMTSGSNETLNLTAGNVHDVTLNNDVTLALTGATNGLGCYMYILLRQGSGAPNNVTWPGSVEWIGGESPTLETAEDAWNWVTLFTMDGGTTWYGEGGLGITGSSGGGGGAAGVVKLNGSNPSTTNTSFEDVSGLSIPLTLSGSNRVFLSLAAVGNNSNAGQTVFFDFAVDGTRIGGDSNGIISITGSTPQDASMGVLTDVLLSGSHTFTVQQRVTANTGTLQAGDSDRTIVFSAFELGGGSGGPIALDDLIDVNAPSPSEGDVLAWDADNDEWIATPVSGSFIIGLDWDTDRYEGGNISVSATTPTALSGPADLVVDAAAGDLIDFSLSALSDTSANSIRFDVATMVGGSAVNFLSSATGTALTLGVSGWFGYASTNRAISGNIRYVVQSGDISGGTVTLRLYSWVSGGSRTVRAVSGDTAIVYSVTNLGQ